MFASAGCATTLAEHHIDGSVAPGPGEPWKQPVGAAPSTSEVAALAGPAPAGPPLPKAGETLSLAKLLDLALANNPNTRAAYFNARAAAAALGSRSSAYYPALRFDVSGGFAHQVLRGGSDSFSSWNAGPSLGLTWMLFDLGGRSADVDEARSILVAANLAQNSVLQDTVLAVEQAYYQYLGAKALEEAAGATLKEAETNLDAANARHQAGVATVADVLQAQTALSQARLSLQGYAGQAAALRGALASSLGLPASLDVEVGKLPAQLEVKPLGTAVDALIAAAEARRPDLARARALAEAAQHHADSVQSRGLPSLGLTANLGRTYYSNSAAPHYGDAYGATLDIAVPLFDGFKDTYDLVEAREQARAAAAQAQSTEQQIILQVWSSYQALQTAALQVQTARDLLQSASQSEAVVAGRYKAGAGSILDVLTAQSALAQARGLDVQARAGWLLAVAQLSRDTGALGLRPEANPTPGQKAP